MGCKALSALLREGDSEVGKLPWPECLDWSAETLSTSLGLSALLCKVGVGAALMLPALSWGLKGEKTIHRYNVIYIFFPAQGLTPQNVNFSMNKIQYRVREDRIRGRIYVRYFRYDGQRSL